MRTSGGTLVRSLSRTTSPPPLTSGRGNPDTCSQSSATSLWSRSLKAAVANRATPVAVRLTLTRDGALETDVRGLPEAPTQPVRVALDDDPVDPSDVWLFHKTTRRAPYERRRDRRPDVDDVVLVNDRDEVTESTIANLAVRFGDALVTPPVDSGLLPGTRRAAMVAAGELVERVVTIDELRASDEIALVSSARGWRSAVIVP